MLVRRPIKITFRTDLMLADSTRFGENHIPRLNHIPDIVLRIGFHAQKGFRRPESRLVLVRYRLTIGIRYAVLRPSAEIAVIGRIITIVVPMAVLVIEDITAVETEIQIAGRESVGEVKTDLGLTQRRQPPFCFVMCIHIKDRFLAVVQMVTEIKQGVRVTDSAADITVVFLARLETRGLREQGIDRSTRSDVRRKFGVLNRRGINRGLYHCRFGRYLTCRLYHRLEITLHSHRAIQHGIVLGEKSNAAQQRYRQH